MSLNIQDSKSPFIIDTVTQIALPLPRSMVSDCHAMKLEHFFK